jgi:hypothetical protein
MSQASDVLSHLRRKPITPMEALGLYGCFRLAARIKDLRDLGHLIGTRTIYKNKKKYAQYFLVKENR